MTRVLLVKGSTLSLFMCMIQHIPFYRLLQNEGENSSCARRELLLHLVVFSIIMYSNLLFNTKGVTIQYEANYT